MFIVGRQNDEVNQYELTPGGTFTEAVANDGSVEGAFNVSISGETFTNAGGTLTYNTDYTISSLPAGLIPLFDVGFDGSFGTFSLSGNATANNNADNVTSLEFTFSNSAFSGGDASAVNEAIAANSEFAIDFEDNPTITYGGFDITTASFTPSTNNPFSVVNEESNSRGVTFSDDGLKMFIVGIDADEVYQYDLNVAFDITTASYTPSTNNPFSVASEDNQSTDITFSNDGLRMFITGNAGNDVNQYELTQPFDITTASFTAVANNPFSVNGQKSVPTGMAFSNAGIQMFIIGHSGNVNQYQLTTAFDITTASFTPATNNPFSVVSEGTLPSGMTFSNNGLRMFILGRNEREVNQYELTTAFDITTASFATTIDNPFSVANVGPSPQGIDFSNDGLRMFIVGSGGDEVNQYDLTPGGAFTEAAANDGSVQGSFNVSITGETFTNAGGTLTYNTDYTISNLPAGLSPIFEVGFDGSFATLSFSGSATDHDDADDVASLEFTFSNSAFTGGDAAFINEAIAASSGFTIDFADGAPLPVELISFTGTVQGNGEVLLEWQTASEVNNDFFEIRHSLTGQSDAFVVLDTIDGNGTTNRLNNYAYTHSEPVRGFNYYQLRQVDFDGAFEFSETIVVTTETDADETTISIFPNPVMDNKLNIAHGFAGENLPIHIQLLDSSGKNVSEIKHVPESLSEELTIDIDSSTPDGTYLLLIQFGNTYYKQQLIVRE